jgi:ATP-binding cassette subfamily C (CFTR/MRP) protein 1
VCDSSVASCAQTLATLTNISLAANLSSLTSIFSQLVNVFAQVEQDMNAAERTITYAGIPPEGASVDLPRSRRSRLTIFVRPLEPVDEKKKTMSSDWPARGAIDFDRVVLRYRDDLPPVLKGMSFSVGAGEKVGIVGRCVRCCRS